MSLALRFPGIFTDEPSLADRHASFNPNRSWIQRTEEFEKYFLKNAVMMF